MVKETKSFEVEVKVAPTALWERFKSGTDITRMMPNVLKSVEIIEGDGRHVGSVRLVKFADGNSAKERLEAIDDRNMSVTWLYVEGTVPGDLKNFRTTVKVLPGGNNSSSTAKWTVDYDTATPIAYGAAPGERETGTNAFKAIEAYLTALG